MRPIPRPALLQSLRLFACCLLPLLLGGCGYTIKGSGINLPPEYRRLAVPLFINRRFESSLEQLLTDAVVQELSRYRQLRIVNEADADAILTGEITDYYLRPASVSSAGVVEEYTFVLVVTLRLKATNPAVTAPLFELERYRFSQTYPAEDNLDTRVEAQEEAWREACEDLASIAVSTLVEGF